MPIHLLDDQDMYAKIVEGYREKRIALNLTQSELAKRTGLSLRTIKGFETGKPITLMSLIKIMRALGEFQRLDSLIPEPLISAKAIYLKEQPPKRRRVRRATP